MNFDPDLLQQPLLSSQIIPELADDDLTIKKFIKTEVKVAKPASLPKPDAHKVILNVNSNPKTIQIKGTAMESSATMQKVQFVKRIPNHLVQITDPKSMVKSNTIINDNVLTSTPIVINKVNGNISGKYHCYSTRQMCTRNTEIQYLMIILLSVLFFKAFEKWFK